MRELTAHPDMTGLKINLHPTDTRQWLKRLRDVLDARAAAHALDFQINSAHIQAINVGNLHGFAPQQCCAPFQDAGALPGQRLLLPDAW